MAVVDCYLRRDHRRSASGRSRSSSAWRCTRSQRSTARARDVASGSPRSRRSRWRSRRRAVTTSSAAGAAHVVFLVAAGCSATHRFAPRVRARGRREGGATRARARDGATPGRRRGAGAHRPRAARRDRARAQRDRRAGRCGRRRVRAATRRSRAQPIRAIDKAARAALADLRRVLGVLHADGAEYEPQPGLARLDSLIDQVRANGPRRRARGRGCTAAAAGERSTSLRTASSRRRSRTRSSTPTRGTRGCAFATATTLRVEIRDDGRGDEAGQPRGERSDRHARAGRAARRHASRPARATAGGYLRDAPASRWATTGEHPRPDRRRPGARAQRVPADPRDTARHQGRRRGRGRRQAVALARELEPDVILMDVRMPELDGIEATRRDRRVGSPTRILVLTTFDLDEYVYARSAPAPAASCSRTFGPRDLVDAIRLVAERERPARSDGDTASARPLRRRRPRTTGVDASALATLTERELEILRLARGRSLERGDRRAARPRRDDREDARLQPPAQARRARSRAGRDRRVRRPASSSPAASRATPLSPDPPIR